ncbi:MAG: hypothetical protein V1837_02585 [Candidatus Woesearchaeota archaeon]
MTGLKRDIVGIISGFFGKETADMVDNYYSEDKPDELIAVAIKMLSGFLGPASANKQLQPLLTKYRKVIHNAS